MPKIIQQNDEEEFDVNDLCGWVPHPDDVQQRVSQLASPTFDDAAPQLAGTWDGKSDAPLWLLCQKVNGGKNLPADKQTIGDCVSHGHARALDYLQCIQIANNLTNTEYVEGKNSIYSEAIYGMMRQQAGALSYQDGASGIWACHTLTTEGAPMRNGRNYNGQNAKQWGAKGTPSNIISEGKIDVLKQYVPITNPRQAADMLSNGYTITVCSNQGFSNQRDQNGMCRPQGSWAHCMGCIGFYLVNGSLVFVILQSWGQNTPSGPTIKGMPDNSFGCDEQTFQRMLNGRDSYALSGIQGYPRQTMNYFV